jgi:predicted PurR-regulated permease PerM
MDKIRMNIKFLLKNRSKKINKVVREIDNGMSNYFKGLLLCIIIQFVEYTVLFYLIGHPNFLLLGVLCSVSSIIPYFGGIIANVFAVITASVAGPKLLILTLLIAFICPNIDGYLISPNVYGKTNKLYPMISIFAVFAGSVLGGFVGILIALPIAIILQILYRSYRDEIKEKLEDIKN